MLPLLLAFLTFTTLSQATDVERIESVRRFVLAAYPELASRDVVFELGTVPYSLNAPWSSIKEASVTLRERQQGARDKWPEIASLALHFGEGALIERGRVSGPLVNTEPASRATLLIASHPEWDDKRVSSALKSAGARLVSSDTANPVLESNVRALEMYFGVVKIEEVEFDRVELTWNVVIALAADPRTSYTVRFESFEGKLVSFFK